MEAFAGMTLTSITLRKVMCNLHAAMTISGKSGGDELQLC